MANSCKRYKYELGYHNDPKFSDICLCRHRSDSDLGAVWSGSTLFAIPSALFGHIIQQVKPPCRNFRVITTIFRVSNFFIFMVTPIVEGWGHSFINHPMGVTCEILNSFIHIFYFRTHTHARTHTKIEFLKPKIFVQKYLIHKKHLQELPGPPVS